MRRTSRVVGFSKAELKKIELPKGDEAIFFFGKNISNIDIIENIGVSEQILDIYLMTYRFSKLTVKRLSAFLEHINYKKKINLVVSNTMPVLTKPEFELLKNSGIFNVNIDNIHAKVIGVRTTNNYYFVSSSENMSSKYSKDETHIIFNDKHVFYETKKMIDKYFLDKIDIEELQEVEVVNNELIKIDADARSISPLKKSFNSSKWTEIDALEILQKCEKWLLQPENFHLGWFLTSELGLYPDVIAYLSGKYKSFSLLYKRIRKLGEQKKVLYGLQDKLNPQILKLDLMVNYDWYENTRNETKDTTEDKAPITINFIKSDQK